MRLTWSTAGAARARHRTRRRRTRTPSRPGAEGPRPGTFPTRLCGPSTPPFRKPCGSRRPGRESTYPSEGSFALVRSAAGSRFGGARGFAPPFAGNPPAGTEEAIEQFLVLLRLRLEGKL